MKKLVSLSIIILILAFFSLSYSQEIGANAPDYSARDYNGNNISLSSLRGKVVLLKFWAAWCGPCIRSLPATWEKHKKYSSQGFTVVMVGLGGQESDSAALSQRGYNFPILIDGKANGRPAGYQFDGIPFEVLIGKDGKILWKGHWGLTNQMVENALSGSSGSPAQNPEPQTNNSGGNDSGRLD